MRWVRRERTGEVMNGKTWGGKTHRRNWKARRVTQGHGLEIKLEIKQTIKPRIMTVALPVTQLSAPLEQTAWSWALLSTTCPVIHQCHCELALLLLLSSPMEYPDRSSHYSHLHKPCGCCNRGLNIHIVRCTFIGRFVTHAHCALTIREAAFSHLKVNLSIQVVMSL